MQGIVDQDPAQGLGQRSAGTLEGRACAPFQGACAALLVRPPTPGTLLLIGGTIRARAALQQRSLAWAGGLRQLALAAKQPCRLVELSTSHTPHSSTLPLLHSSLGVNVPCEVALAGSASSL